MAAALGTISVLQDAGNTSEAGHRDTVGVDTFMPDMRTVGPGAKSMRSADPEASGSIREETTAVRFRHSVPNWH